MRYVFFSKDVYGMRLRNARVRIRRMLNEARAMRDGEKPASSLVTVRENSFIRIENGITIQDILVDHTPEEMEWIERRSLDPTA
ncbi:MAG: hypothetical protein IKD00_05620 [Candidatus Methanomethylophilaceae archaeon]|nr:hypothetical protein [Candidatus Methanomethylophilaceae archaeon]